MGDHDALCSEAGQARTQRRPIHMTRHRACAREALDGEKIGVAIAILSPGLISRFARRL